MILLDLGLRSIGIRDYRQVEEPTLGVTVSYNTMMVYRDGVLQSDDGDYLLSGSTITFVVPPERGSLISAVQYIDGGRAFRRSDVVADGSSQRWTL